MMGKRAPDYEPRGLDSSPCCANSSHVPLGKWPFVDISSVKWGPGSGEGGEPEGHSPLPRILESTPHPGVAITTLAPQATAPPSTHVTLPTPAPRFWGEAKSGALSHAGPIWKVERVGSCCLCIPITHTPTPGCHQGKGPPLTSA